MTTEHCFSLYRDRNYDKQQNLDGKNAEVN